MPARQGKQWCCSACRCCRFKPFPRSRPSLTASPCAVRRVTQVRSSASRGPASTCPQLSKNPSQSVKGCGASLSAAILFKHSHVKRTLLPAADTPVAALDRHMPCPAPALQSNKATSQPPNQTPNQPTNQPTNQNIDTSCWTLCGCSQGSRCSSLTTTHHDSGGPASGCTFAAKRPPLQPPARPQTRP
jgi:hypothetical protein